MTLLKELVWNWLFKDDIDFIQNHYTPVNLEKKILELETAKDELQILFDELSDDYATDKEELSKQIKELQDTIDLFKGAERPVIKPTWLIYGQVFSPRALVANKNGDETVTLQPCDIYTTGNAIKKIVNAKGWKELYATDKKACAHQIWEYVIKNLIYEYDKGEDWRFSTLTLAYSEGDCEDGTIAFIDLCHEAGFKADEVFNAAGWFKNSSGQFGHSYPILNYGEGWKIYETTIDFVPTEPKAFIGSEYSADWGCANWLFAGQIDAGSKQV